MEVRVCNNTIFLRIRNKSLSTRVFCHIYRDWLKLYVNDACDNRERQYKIRSALYLKETIVRQRISIIIGVPKQTSTWDLCSNVIRTLWSGALRICAHKLIKGSSLLISKTIIPRERFSQTKSSPLLFCRNSSIKHPTSIHLSFFFWGKS